MACGCGKNKKPYVVILKDVVDGDVHVFGYRNHDQAMNAIEQFMEASLDDPEEREWYVDEDNGNEVMFMQLEFPVE